MTDHIRLKHRNIIDNFRKHTNNYRQIEHEMDMIYLHFAHIPVYVSTL